MTMTELPARRRPSPRSTAVVVRRTTVPPQRRTLSTTYGVTAALFALAVVLLGAAAVAERLAGEPTLARWLMVGVGAAATGALLAAGTASVRRQR
ncbi:hypothetical protein [Rhizomonospora bruguierae]|uniref:hypothetical protein n=1 Tax=Rhizomonospora bruguierae TaxID=1581705 RepID=UPI001BCD62B7|nr:hypothetical protein [Micromonospora sp. NBRC 107566]